MELTRDELAGYVGLNFSSLPSDYSCDGYWPIVETDSAGDLMIIEISDGQDRELELGGLIDGQIVRSDSQCGFLIKRENEPEI